MRLRRKFVLYLLGLHIVFAAGAAYFLLEHRIWLIAVEVLFAVSLAITLGLVRALFAPIELLRSGIAMIENRDFAARFRTEGPPEAVELYAVYNRMVDHLREERIRLEEQNWFLSRIIEASPSGILIFDFDGRIVTVNPAAERLLSAPAARLTGRSLAELAQNDADGNRNGAGSVETTFAGELLRLENDDPRVLTLRGRRRVKCQRSQFFDRGFSRSFILLEELTEELRQSEKAAYEKLIRMMSHEVNNSLGASRSLLESCLAYGAQLAEEDREDFLAALRVVIGRADRLGAFMSELADVVRLPAPRLSPTNVLKAAEGVAALLARDAEKRRIRFEWDVRDALDGIPADRAQLEQALVNVVKNALEAIGEDGVVTFRTGRLESRRYLQIEDSGPGIPEAARTDLFRPFFTTKENGQGLGLTIVQEVLAAHGFELALESAPGETTRFTILFD
jgi:two-component system nitrogen regulation sensor histidine kinase NtrY